jgi:hypothetical protein
MVRGGDRVMVWGYQWEPTITGYREGRGGGGHHAASIMAAHAVGERWRGWTGGGLSRGGKGGEGRHDEKDDTDVMRKNAEEEDEA